METSNSVGSLGIKERIGIMLSWHLGDMAGTHRLSQVTNADTLNTDDTVDALCEANRELALAYDATLDAWSQALILIDHSKETEGHLQQVTERTLYLARRLGVSEVISS